MKTTEIMLQSWAEGRTRFTQLLPQIKHEDLKKKLANTKNTAGFLIRHISDVELLFAKNFFGAEVEIVPKTLIAQRDTGEWTNLEDLLAYQLHAANVLEGVFSSQSEADWNANVTTLQFGDKTKAELLGRITSHTAYHAGQLALTLKYG
jgi:uncharacterized damage-inducible protein DinB